MALAAVTIDLEQDCPPFLEGYRGIREGLPRLLDMFAEMGTVATFFATGEIARRFPDAIGRIVAAGHELGSHGDTHRRFSTMTATEAETDIARATAALREFADVTSFRAPNLDFPKAYVPILAGHGYLVDSSRARYKRNGLLRGPRMEHGVWRVAASTTPSAIRLPGGVRRTVLAGLREPAVLFFHPWEFVDMRSAPIPVDCRFRTGEPALGALRDAVDWLNRAGRRLVSLSALRREMVPTDA